MTLVLLGVTHYFGNGWVSDAAFVLMWLLALGLCGWVLLPTRARKAPKVEPV